MNQHTIYKHFTDANKWTEGYKSLTEENLQNVKVVKEKYFHHFNDCKCHLPSHPCHINFIYFSNYVLLIPAALTAQRELYVDFHEIWRKTYMTRSGTYGKPKQTSYCENMKSPFNMAAMWRSCLHWNPDRNSRL